MIWSSRATISVASGPTFSGWPLRILIAGLIGMIGAAIFLQTAVHDEEENEDPLAMVSNWASESTKDEEVEEDEVDMEEEDVGVVVEHEKNTILSSPRRDSTGRILSPRIESQHCCHAQWSRNSFRFVVALLRPKESMRSSVKPGMTLWH